MKHIFILLFVLGSAQLAMASQWGDCRYSRAEDSQGLRERNTADNTRNCSAASANENKLCVAVVLCNGDRIIQNVMCKSRVGNGRRVCPTAEQCHDETASSTQPVAFAPTEIDNDPDANAGGGTLNAR